MAMHDPVPASPATPTAPPQKPHVEVPMVKWRCPYGDKVIEHPLGAFPEADVDAHIATHPRGGAV